MPPSTTAKTAGTSSYLSRDERDALREVKPGAPSQALLRKEADLQYSGFDGEGGGGLINRVLVLLLRLSMLA